MPNYGLVINSTYNPMSYEQYVAPFKDYAEVYNKVADQYDALEMEANKWEKLASSSQDQAQYEQYKNYARDLRAAANDLAENGLSTKTRGLVSSLRGRYASEIQPIEEAYNYRAKLAEEQRKLNPKGDLQWDIDFSKIGLGAIMSNPTLSYSPGRSLSEMEQAGEDIGKAASTRRVLSEKARDMGNQYYRVMKGYDGGDVQAFLDKNVNDPAFQELMQLYDQVRTSYGTNNTQSIYSAEQNSIADERILTGMLKGLAYNEDYQTNYKEKPTGKKTEGGSDYSSEAIGYQLMVDGKIYTKTYEFGQTAYYDDSGNKYTYRPIKQNDEGKVVYGYMSNSGEIIDFNKQTKDEKGLSENRYIAIPVNNSSTKMYIGDTWNNNKKLSGENGELLVFDVSKENLNTVTGKIESINPPKQDSETQYSIPQGKEYIIRMDYDGNELSSTTRKYTDDDSSEYAEDTKVMDIKKIKEEYENTFNISEEEFANLSAEEKASIQENRNNIKKKYSYYNNLPQWVKDNPDAYIVTVGRAKRAHDRIVKIISRTNYTKKN